MEWQHITASKTFITLAPDGIPGARYVLQFLFTKKITKLPIIQPTQKLEKK
jgi:hypothetical protein